ncbi:hypothetical protein MSMTP_2144 [Methanosarcina sp. MTP4]|nr:hypothetical protein MSMTP_2144 [Methanosarcina sp. MTP4]
MYGADIKMTVEDFELAKPPLSKKFIKQAFEKYEVQHIAHFGGEMFYVAGTDSEPIIPIYTDATYPPEIELIFDFMARERIRMIRYEKGVIYRTEIPKIPDSNGP